jgi:hypothetical protein
MGPFPEDKNGNKYIIVVIDVFSRFVELYAVPELSAENSAKILIEYTSRYATPDRILSDNGRELEEVPRGVSLLRRVTRDLRTDCTLLLEFR